MIAYIVFHIACAAIIEKLAPKYDSIAASCMDWVIERTK